MLTRPALGPAGARGATFDLFDVVRLLRPREWRGQIIPAGTVGAIVDVSDAHDVYGLEIEALSCVIGVRGDEIELDESTPPRAH